MHIVQLVPELNQGGVERYVVELSRELVRLGHSCTVISAGGKLVRQIENEGGMHVTLDICSKNPLTFLSRALKLRAELLKRSPDVLHAHSRVPAWLCRVANKQLRIPMVTTVHGFNHIGRYSQIMTQGDAVICVSDSIKQYIQKHYGTEESRISIIPCGVDLKEFNPDNLDWKWIENFREEFRLNDRYIVANIGRITPLKDHETFIGAIAEAAKIIPNICGLIVGGARHDKRALYSRLQKLASELGIEEHIVFAGSQTRLAEIYALSHALVSSSKKPESFGLTILESLAMNTPVIATCHGGVLDMIEDGVNGRFFAPGNTKELTRQLIKTYECPLEDLRRGITATFSLEKTASQILNLYEQLTSTLHIVQILPELNQGGVERGVVELNRELVKRGHTSTVISAGGNQAAQIEKDGGHHVSLGVCSKNPLTVPFRILALRRTLHALHPAPSILHARSRVPAWLCRFANKKLHIPYITTVHGFNSISKYSEIMTDGDRVIYGSSSIKEYILNNYPVDESKLRYVPRGIDTNYFDPEAVDHDFMDEFKQTHGLEGKTIITIVGRITEWKGHDTFIRALAEVQKYRPDVVGVAAGGIWHGKEDFFQGLEKLAADLNAPVLFVGSQTQVREIYALSDLVVSAASSKAETFGRTAAEALAMNTPVVASSHGGTLDILLDGENGLLFEPGNVLDLAEKINLALNHSFENMRPHIEENFSLDRMTEKELAVYHELIS